MPRPSQRHYAVSVRIGLGADVGHRLLNCEYLAAANRTCSSRKLTAMDCVRIFVRDFNAEFFLNRHHDLHRI